MRTTHNKSEISQIRTVGANGQISIGKKRAGVQMQVFEQDEDTIILKSVVVIPKNEMWLHRGDNLAKINKSIEWIESNPRRDNFDEIIEKLDHVKG